MDIRIEESRGVRMCACAHHSTYVKSHSVHRKYNCPSPSSPLLCRVPPAQGPKAPGCTWLVSMKWLGETRNMGLNGRRHSSRFSSEQPLGTATPQALPSHSERVHLRHSKNTSPSSRRCSRRECPALNHAHRVKAKRRPRIL